MISIRGLVGATRRALVGKSTGMNSFSTFAGGLRAGDSNKKQGSDNAFSHDSLMKMLDDVTSNKRKATNTPTFPNISEIDIPGEFEELVGHQQQEDKLKNEFLNQRIPRTGVMASRSVTVNGQSGGLQAALRLLRIKNSANKIPRTLNLQRYHERPGKKKQRLRMEKQQREFNMGIRRLFKLVNEARRKGY